MILARNTRVLSAHVPQRYKHLVILTVDTLAKVILYCLQIPISNRRRTRRRRLSFDYPMTRACLKQKVNPEGVGINIGSTLVDPRESLVREILPVAKRLRRHAETLIGSRMPAPVVAAKATVVGRNVGTPGEGDICLSMAFGVSALQLATFAGSFRDVSPRADLVMFFEAPASPRFKEIIEK